MDWNKNNKEEHPCKKSGKSFQNVQGVAKKKSEWELRPKVLFNCHPALCLYFFTTVGSWDVTWIVYVSPIYHIIP